MFIFFDARMSFARTLTVLLFMFCTGFAETTENDVCDFDDSLAILLIRSVQSHTSHSEVLDYILQDSLSVNHEICKDEYKVQAISAKVTSLYNTSKTAKNVEAYDIAYTNTSIFLARKRTAKHFLTKTTRFLTSSWITSSPNMTSISQTSSGTCFRKPSAEKNPSTDSNPN